MKVLALTIFLILILIIGYRLYSYHPLKPDNSYKSSFILLNQPQNPVDKIVKNLYPEPEASLLSGILIGTKAQMPADFYNNLQKTGTMHMIALSGQNISLVISLLAYLFAPLGKRLSSILTIFCICAFIAFVGPSASVIRAGLMGSFVMLSIIFGRQYLAILGLFICGLIMIVISPDVLFNIGWQLSYGATLGIILLSAKAGTKKKKTIVSSLTSGMLLDLKTTLSAQLFTMPIVLYNFHNLSLVAPLTNVLILWSIPILMYGGFFIVLVRFVTTLAMIFFDSLSHIVSMFIYPLLVWFVAVVNWTASLPFASFTINNFPLWSAYLYYGVLFLILAVIKTNSTHKTNLPHET